MALDLVDYDSKAQEAIKAFWGDREPVKKTQGQAGQIDQGERSAVTSGKNLDGFIALIRDVVEANGLPHADIQQSKALLTLPGYFRSTKRWDLVVIHEGRLVAAVELKSQVGASFGNDFNNCSDGAIGCAHDLRSAYSENALGEQRWPFVGWLMVVEDATGGQTLTLDQSIHLPVSEEFQGTSYLKRYDILCRRLMKERLYTSASVIATPRNAATSGEYRDLSPMTGLREFIAAFAAHIAVEAIR